MRAAGSGVTEFSGMVVCVSEGETMAVSVISPADVTDSLVGVISVMDVAGRGVSSGGVVAVATGSSVGPSP